MTYVELMKSHLGSYKTTHLGVGQSGKWRNLEYAHVLPPERMMLNILEPIHPAFDQYRAAHPDLKLHRDFAHLNSSQAACINLFLPLFSGAIQGAIPGKCPLPFRPADVKNYRFECVRNKQEGTNFDFWVRTAASQEVFCEFKLTEGGFGKAKDDKQHRQKLENIYLPMLTGKVRPEVLQPASFFVRYQLLRNVAYADANGSTSVLFVVPRANEQLAKPLVEMRDWLAPALHSFVTVVYLEDIISWLRATSPSDLATYYEKFAAKYLP